jgi:hypothetical protein
MATATDESVKKNNGEKKVLTPAAQSHQVTLDWLNVYAQVYRETLTPELIIAYQMALAGVKPAILHKAFQRQMKLSTFRPTPAEVLQAAAIEFENVPKPKQLEADAGPMSAEERAQVGSFFDDLRNKLSLPAYKPFNETSRREELKRQSRDIMSKYAATKSKK